MLDIAYNISQDPFQTKHRPLTPNTIETGAFLTHTCPFASHTQYPIYMKRLKVTYEDEINAENQKILVLLTNKCYISLTTYLNMHFKPNIDL